MDVRIFGSKQDVLIASKRTKPTFYSQNPLTPQPPKTAHPDCFVICGEIAITLLAQNNGSKSGNHGLNQSYKISI